MDFFFTNNFTFIFGLLLGLAGLLCVLFLFFAWIWFMQTAQGPLSYSKFEARMLIFLIINTVVSSTNLRYNFELIPKNGQVDKLVVISWITAALWFYLIVKALIIMVQESSMGRSFKITKDTFTKDILP